MAGLADSSAPGEARILRRMNRTLVICKPDAVERGLVGEILSRFERRQLKIVAAELRVIDRDLASQHYAEHEGKGFYEDLSLIHI